MSSFFKYLLVVLKGVCMGAADVVPGVSGGTIAFMTGIYEELIGSIKSVDATAVKLFFTGRFKEFWVHINGWFLLSVVAGIFISVVSLAKVMQFILEAHPIQTWAFFFGLIVASVLFILRGVKGWKFKDLLILALGVILGVVICTLRPANTPDAIWFVFICGAIAICAMILPGVSGSFILLILGKYQYIMTMISNVVDGVDRSNSILVLLVFAVGAVVGILSFSKLLNWLMSKYNRLTLLALAGFIIGSLVIVWPWASEESKVIAQTDPHIVGAIVFSLVGFSLVTIIEGIGGIISKRKVGQSNN